MTRSRDVASNGGLVLINTTAVSAASSATISNVFSSTYQNYKVEITTSALSAATSTLNMQFTTGGTASATAYYGAGNYALENASGGYNGTANATSYYLTSTHSTYPYNTAVSMDIMDVYNAVPTKFIFQSYGVTPSPASQSYTSAGMHYVSTSYDGIKINIGSGTFSGNIRIYGYRN